MSICLLTIDPQFDFCDPSGNLSVPGADKDMERLNAMIIKNKMDIDDIQITLDSHHMYHIAHPIALIDQNGNHPAPYTLIPFEDVDATYDTNGKLLSGNPKFKATVPVYRQRYVDYCKQLKDNNRYVLVIWPPHCLIGDPGGVIYKPFLEAMYEWESQVAIVGKTTKGSNPHTEHYSAVKADVYDPGDTTTGLNTALIDLLQIHDTILISGEALSHCVANTINDVANEFTVDEIKKFTLLEDACSNVPTFEKMGEDFVNDMVSKGMNISKTTTFFK